MPAEGFGTVFPSADGTTRLPLGYDTAGTGNDLTRVRADFTHLPCLNEFRVTVHESNLYAGLVANSR